ncbi:MAG TPA: NAD(P)-dependent methylenetetrahydromethanopterin dehydrogenase [Gemmatimonadaceae bacterium]|nr:NAD(P)-dependent methylenetetrahydromethanopterin dehydrogenase [Gemmatimonadaceae bacterium]
MKKLLVQLDSSRSPSTFDQVVAYDSGVDDILSYGGIGEADVRDLVHGCIFTRSPNHLQNTAIFIGGTDIGIGAKLLSTAQQAFFGPFRVSVMLDSNGSNTTAAAAVVKLVQAVGDIHGKRVVLTAGTGPVGRRAAGLLAKAGADVTITSRNTEEGTRAAQGIHDRFGGTVTCVLMRDASEANTVLDEAKPELLLNTGPAGVNLVPRSAWEGRKGLLVAADLNAVPPLGIEGIESKDDGAKRGSITVFGALGIGGLKMKVHKACLARLFERNDLVLDADTIFEVARETVRQ